MSRGLYKPKTYFERHSQNFGYDGYSHYITLLNRNGLYGNRSRRTPLHKPYHTLTRFNFTETFLDKENCFWGQVLWSDGTKIELFGHNDEDLAQKGDVFSQRTHCQH